LPSIPISSISSISSIISTTPISISISIPTPISISISISIFSFLRLRISLLIGKKSEIRPDRDGLGYPVEAHPPMIGHLPAHQPMRAILLNQRPFHESSVIGEWVVEPLGLVDTLARGLRRQRRNPDRPDLFQGWLLWVIPSRTSHLHTLSKLEPDPSAPPRIRPRPADLLQASTFSKWLRANTAREYPSARPYQLFAATLTDLATHGPSQAQTVSFILKLMRIHGGLPDWQRCGRCHATLSHDTKAMIAPQIGEVLCPRCAAIGAPPAAGWVSPHLRENLSILSWTPLHDLPAELRTADLDQEFRIASDLAQYQDIRLTPSS
jgi:DNA repair protein RecO